MATKSRSRSRNGKKLTLPLAIVGGFMPLTINTIRTPGGWDRKLWMATQAITGYDTDAGKFWFPNLYKGAVPIGVGFLIHAIANKLGINRALSRSGIPLIRV